MTGGARHLVVTVCIGLAMGCELLVGTDDYELIGSDVGDGSVADATDDGGEPADAADAAAPPPKFDNVTIIASGQAGPRGIALGETDVYWTNFDADTIGSTSKNGDGGVAPAITGADHPGCLDIVAYGSTLAWLNTKQGTLIVAPRSAQPIAVKNCGTGVRMTQDAVNLWYTELCSATETNLWRVPKTGPKVFASQALAPDAYGALASDGLSVFAAKPTGIADALRPADAGLLAPTTGAALDIAVDATAVYWIHGDGTVNRHEKGEGAATQVLASGQAGLARLALFGDDVYWTAGGASPAEGTVMIAPKNGSAAPRALATGQKQPFGIAIDESGVYWANAGDGTIAKVARVP